MKLETFEKSPHLWKKSTHIHYQSTEIRTFKIRYVCIDSVKQYLTLETEIFSRREVVSHTPGESLLTHWNAHNHTLNNIFESNSPSTSFGEVTYSNWNFSVYLLSFRCCDKVSNLEYCVSCGTTICLNYLVVLLWYFTHRCFCAEIMYWGSAVFEVLKEGSLFCCAFITNTEGSPLIKSWVLLLCGNYCIRKLINWYFTSFLEGSLTDISFDYYSTSLQTDKAYFGNTATKLNVSSPT